MVCYIMTEYLSGEITARLLRALKRLPVVVLSGLRQTGKTTLLQKEAGLARGRRYRALDDFATLVAAQSNPESLLEDRPLRVHPPHRRRRLYPPVRSGRS